MLLSNSATVAASSLKPKDNAVVSIGFFIYSGISASCCPGSTKRSLPPFTFNCGRVSSFVSSVVVVTVVVVVCAVVVVVAVVVVTSGASGVT